VRKKKYFVLGRLEQPWQNKIFCIPARQAQQTNQERIPFICSLLVSIHLSFNSQQGPPLSAVVSLGVTARNSSEKKQPTVSLSEIETKEAASGSVTTATCHSKMTIKLNKICVPTKIASSSLTSKEEASESYCYK
jgi:hypothetical protein